MAEIVIVKPPDINRIAQLLVEIVSRDKPYEIAAKVTKKDRPENG